MFGVFAIRSAITIANAFNNPAAQKKNNQWEEAQMPEQPKFKPGQTCALTTDGGSSHEVKISCVCPNDPTGKTYVVALKNIMTRAKEHELQSKN